MLPKMRWDPISCQSCGSKNLGRRDEDFQAFCLDCGQHPIDYDCVGKIPQEVVDRMVKDEIRTQERLASFILENQKRLENPYTPMYRGKWIEE